MTSFFARKRKVKVIKYEHRNLTTTQFFTFIKPNALLTWLKFKKTHYQESRKRAYS